MRCSFDRLRLPVVVVLTFCLFCTPVFAQKLTSMGPLGGDVRSLVADPVRPNLLYLGTADGYIYGSQDAGEHWQPLGHVADGVVTAIVVSADASGVVFSSVWTAEKDGEGGGVFSSRDNGKTWQTAGLAGHAVRALVQAPSDPRILVAGALDGVFRSNDSGKNWVRITPPEDLELRNFDSLAIDPQNPEIIYAGTFHLPWKTIDGGKNWEPIYSGMIDDSDVLSMEVDSSNPQRIFASACSGIYRSEDAGANWRKVEGVPYSARRTLVIKQDPSNSAILFAGTTEGLWKTADGGAVWHRISPKDWVINSILVEPSASASSGDERVATSIARTRLLIGTEDRGVLGSDDSGDHFLPFNEGFHHRQIVSIALDAGKPGTVAMVLANSPDKIVQTEDGGLTWSSIDAGLNRNSITQIFSSPVGWYATLDSGGLARFDLQAGKWSSPKNTDAFRFVVNDMAFAEKIWFAASPAGLFVTRDYGVTWNTLPFSSGDLAVDSVRVSADGQKLRIVSSNAMVFSDDAGKSWTWHDLPLDSGGAIRLEFAANGTLLAAARNALYVSRDDGATWQKLQNGLPAAKANDFLIHNDQWLVSMQGRGLFLSQDQGASWSPVKDPGGTGVYGQLSILASGAADGLIYAGSFHDGLYTLDLPRISASKTRVSASTGK
jgi:photosystem II stability/assembly factor-like uncharacterized protein